MSEFTTKYCTHFRCRIASAADLARLASNLMGDRRWALEKLAKELALAEGQEVKCRLEQLTDRRRT